MTFSLHTVDDTGAVSAAIGVSDTTTSTGRESLTIASLTETVVAANASYVLKLVSDGSGGVTAGNVAITYDRP
jgi:hypothetical protein